MRITLLVYRYWPVVGGVEKYVHQLAKALLAMGHRVEVVAAATEPDLKEREIHDGVAIRRFPALRSPLRARLWLWRNLDLFRGADVIHVSNTHMLEYFWRMVGFLVDRRKVFLTRHGMSYIHPVPESEKRRALRSRSMAAGIVHDGAFIEKWLGVRPDLCPDQGLDPSAAELPFVPEPPPDSAAYVGRLETDSGIGIYIDAVRILCKQRGRRFGLNVYGDGSLAPELREQCAREELPVHFHGRTPEAQRRISESCFALIDGRMAIQEAMARRRLVLASYVDPLKKDYVGTERFSPHIVPVGDARQLADRVEFYIDHPKERAELVSRAFEHALDLTWERTARAYLQFWTERLAEPRKAGSTASALKLAWSLSRETGIPKAEWAPGLATAAGEI